MRKVNFGLIWFGCRPNSGGLCLKIENCKFLGFDSTFE